MGEPPGRKKILVVDDEEAIRQSFIDYLEDRGFFVMAAENGQEGLDLLARQQADLVIVDLRMPQMDGFEFMRRCGLLAQGVPVIVISGTSRTYEAFEARQLGASDYLVKPLKELSVLGRAVDRALQQG